MSARIMLPRWFGVLGLSAMLAWTQAGLAQRPQSLQQPPRRAPSDPVEELRQSLKIDVDPTPKPEELTFRRDNLTRRAEALKTPGEIRRALTLEWKDLDRQQKEVAKIDQTIRAGLVRRLEQTLRNMLQQGDATQRLAAATLLAEMGTSVRGAEGLTGFAQSMAPELAKLTKAPDARVREAAAQALGKIHPDPKVAAPALSGLLEKDEAGPRRAAAEALLNLMQGVTQPYKSKGSDSKEQQPELSGQEQAAEVVNYGRAVVPVAARSLADPDPEIRRLAANTLRAAAMALAERVGEPDKRGFIPPGR